MSEEDIKKKKLDAVGQEDGDVDNDGDKDDSDKYLLKRRKAVTKGASKEDEPKKKDSEETAVMNPKKDDKKSAAIEQKESFRTRLLSIYENKHTAGATKPEEMDSKDSPTAKKMRDDHKAVEPKDSIDANKGPVDDVKKAANATKQAPARAGDSKIGDKTVVKGALTAKESVSFASMLNNVNAAYK